MSNMIIDTDNTLYIHYELCLVVAASIISITQSDLGIYVQIEGEI